MKHFPFLLAVTLFASACNSDSRQINITENTPLEDGAAMIIGYSAGESFREQAAMMDDFPFEFNLELIRAGFLAGLRGDSLNITDAEADSIMFHFQEMAMIAMAEAEERNAEENLVEGREFLERYDAEHEDVLVTETGLRFRTVTEGEGPTAQIQDMAVIHYHGTLPNGDVFDSSRERGEPAHFPVGRLVPGFIEALLMMQAGGTYEIVLPHNTAYGSQAPPEIGPNRTLKFEVEVLEIQSPQ